jgi:hypothetical protein
VLLIVGLDRWRMLLVICRMALYTESTNYNAGSWIFLICADLRFRHQAVWREAHGQNPCSCLKKSVAYHNWFALPERPVGFWCTCTICLAEVFEDSSEQKCHEERSLVQDLRTCMGWSVKLVYMGWSVKLVYMGWSVKLVYMAGVRTGVHVLQFVRGLYSRWETRYFFMYQYQTLNSETLRRVPKADLHLASFDSSCWSAQVSNAFNGLQSSAIFNRNCWEPYRFPCKSSFAICVSDIWRCGGKLIFHVLTQ